MGDARRRKCKGCGRRDTEVGELSWRGLCTECGPAKVEVTCEALRRKSGPEFHHWRQQMAASVGGVLLDDLPPAA